MINAQSIVSSFDGYAGADTGFRKGEGGSGLLLSTKTQRICSRTCDIFSLFMKFGASPKGGVLTQKGGS